MYLVRGCNGAVVNIHLHAPGRLVASQNTLLWRGIRVGKLASRSAKLRGVERELPLPCRKARARVGGVLSSQTPVCTANLRTKILGFRGFDSSIILILRGATLMFVGDLPESLSQAILAWATLAVEIWADASPSGRWGFLVN